MPSGGGPVYQPTTVSYEPRPGGILGQSSVGDSPLKVLRKPKPQVALLLFALISLAAGVAMIASGTADIVETDAEAHIEQEQQQQEEAATEEQDSAATPSADSVETSNVELPLGVLLGGVFMTIVGFVAIGLYLKVADWRRNCVCPSLFNKKQSLARLQGNSSGGCGGQIMALNPSTDPLVSHTQYAPASEMPQRLEDEERRNLMPDNKDCVSSAEESDRMLEPDPRIVLRPMGRVEDA